MAASLASWCSAGQGEPQTRRALPNRPLLAPSCGRRVAVLSARSGRNWLRGLGEAGDPGSGRRSSGLSGRARPFGPDCITLDWSRSRLA